MDKLAQCGSDSAKFKIKRENFDEEIKVSVVCSAAGLDYVSVSLIENKCESIFHLSPSPTINTLFELNQFLLLTSRRSAIFSKTKNQLSIHLYCYT